VALVVVPDPQSSLDCPIPVLPSADLHFDLVLLGYRALVTKKMTHPSSGDRLHGFEDVVRVLRNRQILEEERPGQIAGRERCDPTYAPSGACLRVQLAKEEGRAVTIGMSVHRGTTDHVAPVDAAAHGSAP
jgi:hypothetical protein